MLKRTVLFLLLSFIINSPSLYSQLNTGSFNISWKAPNGDEYIIGVHVPDNYDPDKQYTFVLAFHGQGGNGANMRDFVYNLESKAQIETILYCPSYTNASSDILNNLINVCLQHSHENYNIDPNNKIACGFSAGGRLAYLLGLSNSDLFTGIIALSPAIASLDDTLWPNITKIKMATILGDKDFNFDLVDPFLKDIQNKGGDLKYILKSGVEHGGLYWTTQQCAADYKICYDHVYNSSLKVDNPTASTNYQLTLYPNPVENILNIQSASSIKTIQIYNLYGELLHVYQPNNEANYSIDLSQLPASSYIMQITDINQSTISKTFIKR